MTREEAVQELKYIYDSLVSCDLSYEALDMAIKSLSADVKPIVKGEWIDKSGNVVYPFWDRFTCSVCGKSADASPYCPNCGAKMDGDSNV